ncbi:L-rhamnose mutarotase [Halocatena marina]|uniref:L-rhamnose mutarotase n=1 Tax=Halocatena marina TaxID=2934937 RepID=A0ABD5YYD9_9EURY|nr:L-rhamnose mutarotase [Halocatena marina]
MERIAFHLRIKEGQRQAYREEHEAVPEALESAYVDSGAGLKTYSVFEKMDTSSVIWKSKTPEAIRTVMEESDEQADWAEMMGSIVIDEDDTWMDEGYRMV